MQGEFSEVDSPDPGGEQTPTLPNPGTSSSPQESDPPTQSSTGNNSYDGPRDNIPCLQYGLYILWKTWNNCGCLGYVAVFFFLVVYFFKLNITETSLIVLSVCCRVRSSPLKQSPGYQVELVIQLVWVSGEPPQPITSLAINSSYGL